MLDKYKKLFKGIDVVLTPMAMESIYQQAIAKEADGNEFLLKMEIRRILKPLRQTIDLRGKVDGICEYHELDGVGHWLDNIALSVYMDKIASFGQYTVGVYEAVHQAENNFKVRYEKSTAAAKQAYLSGEADSEDVSAETTPTFSYLVPSYCFADIDRRQEERMNFYSKIELMTETGTRITTKSLDLSLHGIRLKTESETVLNESDIVGLYFTELSERYVLDGINGERYQVVNIQTLEHERHLGLKRVEVDLKDQVSQFLAGLIRTLKPVRKVNVSNTLRALNIKGLEQYYLKGGRSFPVFLAKTKQGILPRYALTNEINDKALCYWSNEQHRICIDSLLHPSRLAHIVNQGITEFYAYAFSTFSHDEDVVFYTATDYELAENAYLQSSFLAYASRQASWRVFKVQVRPIQSTQMLRPLTTPQGKRDIDEGVTRFSERAQKIVAMLSHILVMTEVTDEIHVRSYHRYKLSQKHYKELLRFRQPEVLNSKSLIMLQLHNLRGEVKQTKSPFPVRTRVIISQDDIALEAQSNDITAQSARLALRESFPWELGDVVEISLPELQQTTKRHVLKNIPYVVDEIGAGGKFVVVKPHKLKDSDMHVADYFFVNHSRAIAEKVLGQPATSISDLGEALRNIYINNAVSYGLYFKQQGRYRLPARISRPVTDSSLVGLFNLGIEHYQTRLLQNMYSVFSQGEFETHFITLLLKLMSQRNRLGVKEVVMRELFLAFTPQAKTIEKMITSTLSSELTNDEACRVYIANAMSRGVFYAMSLSFARAGNINWEYLKEERHYVRKNTSESLNQFEHELKRIMCYCEVIDTTDEVMRRHGFAREEIEQNQRNRMAAHAGSEHR